MALLLSALTAGLESVAADPPATEALCAVDWADAVEAYAIGIVPPSTTVVAAAAVLSIALTAAFNLAAAAPAMETGFATFALAVGGGMAGFVSTPPPGIVGFVAQFAGPKPTTHAAAATAVGGIIDIWMRTGSSVPTGGGPPIPWS